MTEEQLVRKVIFAINITIDGYCGHEKGIADDELHEYFTRLLQASDVDIFRAEHVSLDVSILARCCSESIGDENDQ